VVKRYSKIFTKKIWGTKLSPSTRAPPYRHHRAPVAAGHTGFIIGGGPIRPSMLLAVLPARRVPSGVSSAQPCSRRGVSSSDQLSSAARAGTNCRGRSCRIWTDRTAGGSSVGLGVWQVYRVRVPLLARALSGRVTYVNVTLRW